MKPTNPEDIELFALGAGVKGATRNMEFQEGVKADGEVMRTTIPMVDQGVTRAHRALVQGLLERVERQVGTQRVRHPPAHDTSRVGVDDEGDIDEPRPRRHVRQVREPQGVRTRSPEHPIDPVRRARELRHRGRRLHPLAPHHAAKAKRASAAPPCSARPRCLHDGAGATPVHAPAGIRRSYSPIPMSM